MSGQRTRYARFNVDPDSPPTVDCCQCGYQLAEAGLWHHTPWLAVVYFPPGMNQEGHIWRPGARLRARARAGAGPLPRRRPSGPQRSAAQPYGRAIVWVYRDAPLDPDVWPPESRTPGKPIGVECPRCSQIQGIDRHLPARSGALPPGTRERSPAQPRRPSIGPPAPDPIDYLRGGY